MSYIRKRNGVNHLLLAKHNGVEKRLIEKNNGVETPMFKFDITTTSSPQTFTIVCRTTGNVSYNANIDWGDESAESVITAGDDGDLAHEYATAGTYTVRIRGRFRGLRIVNTGDKLLYDDIKQWGCLEPVYDSNASTFYGCANMVVSATDNWDGMGGIVAKILYPNFMFTDCSSITAIANSDNWDLSSALGLTQMFQNCSSLATLVVTNWDVGNVAIFDSAFSGCAAWTGGDPSGWDTSSATSFISTFYNCQLLDFDASGWDVSGVTSFNQMFHKSGFNNDSQALSTYTGGTPTGWNTASATGTAFQNTFRDCPFNQVISGFDMNGVTVCNYMFYENTSFNKDVSDWDMSTVTNPQYMFYGATAFNNGGVALDWADTGEFTTCTYMFWNADAFNVSIDGWDVSKVTNFNYMFGATAIYNQSMSSWTLNSTSAVTMEGMFQTALLFNQDISMWDMSKVSTIRFFAYGATAWNNGGNALDWADTSEIANWSYAFGGVNTTISCKINVDMSSLDTSGATNMLGIFARNTTFNQDISDWDVSGVTTFQLAFDQCTAFNNGGAALSDYNGGGAVLGWVTTAATDMQNMFYACSNFNADISGFDMNGVTTIYRMLYNCTSFNCGGNSEIDNWDMTTIETAYEFGQNLDAFTQDIGSWDMGACTNFQGMFNAADAVDFDMSSWDFSSATNVNYIFNNSGLSTANYNLLLQAFDAIPLTSLTMVATGLTHSGDGTTARTSLINDHSWSISGDSAA